MIKVQERKMGILYITIGAIYLVAAIGGFLSKRKPVKDFLLGIIYFGAGLLMLLSSA